MSKEDSTEEIKAEDLIKSYENLEILFNEKNQDPDDIEVREFMKIMLELKN